MSAWPPAFDTDTDDISPMMARLFHIRKYRDMVRAQVQTLRARQDDRESAPDATLGRYLVSRLLLLEELDETIQQLEALRA